MFSFLRTALPAFACVFYYVVVVLIYSQILFMYKGDELLVM